jgi:hypothetical protein
MKRGGTAGLGEVAVRRTFERRTHGWSSAQLSERTLPDVTVMPLDLAHLANVQCL